MKLERLRSTSRMALVGVTALLFLNLPVPAWSQQNLWADYKQQFLSEDGRIIDDVNGRISHSEGQGYGLILAELNQDRDAFEHIWKWTQTNLRQRTDHLFAWRWKPASSGTAGDKNGAVDDKNNATDGDLLIAFGLANAGKDWHDTAFLASSKQIAQDIRRHMIRQSRYGPVLLPGGHGFEKPDGIVVNLSYWVFPAFAVLAKIDPSPQWAALRRSGLQLVEAARFSPLQLPPDWLFIGKKDLQIAKDFEPVYGYNAVRIPLYLVWAGVADSKYYTGFRAVVPDPEKGALPAKIFLPSGKYGPDPCPPGMAAIYKLIAGRGDIQIGGLTPPYEGETKDAHYYSMTLGLLTNYVAGAKPAENQTPSR